MSEMREGTPLGLPAVESGVGADPQSSGAIQRQGMDLIAAQRAGNRRVVTQVLEAPGRRVQNIDSRVHRADPETAARIQHQGARCIAGERTGRRWIVSVDGKAVRRPVPTGNACILDRDPQIMVCVFDDLVDVVAR